MVLAGQVRAETGRIPPSGGMRLPLPDQVLARVRRLSPGTEYSGRRSGEWM